MANNYSHLGFVADEEEKTSPEEASDEIGTLEAAVLGAQEGATFHLGKRGLAAFRAATGDKTYTEELEAIQKILDEARKAHPFAYGGSELLGALVNPLPGAAAKAGAEALGASKLAKSIGGLTESLAGSKLASKLGLVAAEEIPNVTTLFAKPTAAGLGKLAEKATTGSIEAGLIGGGVEALEGEGDLSDIAKATGGAMAFGAALPAGGVALGRVGKKLEDYDWWEKVKRSYNLAKEGIGIGSMSGQNVIWGKGREVAQKMRNASKSLIEQAKQQFDDYIEQNQNVLDKAGNIVGPYRFSTKDPSVGNDLKEVINILENNKPVFDKLLDSKTFLSDLLKQRSVGMYGPEDYEPTLKQLSDLRKQLIEGLGKEAPEGFDRDLRKLVVGEKGIIKKVEDIINKKFDRYSTLKNNINEAAKPAEMLIGQTTDPDAATVFFSDLPEATQNKKLDDIGKRLMERYFRGGTLSADSRAILDEFFNQLSNAAKIVGKESSGKVGPSYKGAPDFGDPNALAQMLKMMKGQAGSGLEQKIKDTSKQAKEAFSAESIAMLRNEAKEAAGNIAAMSALEGVRPEADMPTGANIPIPTKLSIINPATWLSVGSTEAAKYAGAIAGMPPITTYGKLRQFNIKQLQDLAGKLSKSDSPALANIGRNAAQSLGGRPGDTAKTVGDSINKAVFIHQIMTNPSIRKELGIDLSKENQEEEENIPVFTDEELKNPFKPR